MTQSPLYVYRIDMKYIRNLHNIDDRIFSVSPQIGKNERPFLGIIIVCNKHQYCVPLSRPKKKHEKMRDKIDFKKIIHNGVLIGVLNFNLMIPVEALEWCNRHVSDLANTANVLYQKYNSDENFTARKQCLDFKRMEQECEKYNSRIKKDQQDH